MVIANYRIQTDEGTVIEVKKKYLSAADKDIILSGEPFTYRHRMEFDGALHGRTIQRNSVRCTKAEDAGTYYIFHIELLSVNDPHYTKARQQNNKGHLFGWSTFR